MASRKRSGRVRGLVGLAEVAFQRGRYTRARRYARSAVSAGGGWPAKLVLGNIYYKQRNYKKAVQMYDLVLTYRPNHREAKRNRAAARKRLNM